jgi:methylenetetrahydrofolate dehydrogenase (NADP+)/methenyltetrahydrofolate cyclohydrolase
MKKIIRKKLAEKRKALPLAKVKADSEKIKNKLLATPQIKNSQKIGLYFSKDKEVLTEEIIIDLLKKGKKVFLPRVKYENNGQEDKNLEFCEIKKLGDLEKGSYGIMEPKSGCLKIKPDKLDLLIIPCVGLDGKGNRLGRGAGMYDKLLTKHPGIKTACLAYDFQVLPEIPIEEHDQKAEIIITEKKIIKTCYTRYNNKEWKLLDGKLLSQQILEDIKNEIQKNKIKLKLSVILIGDEPASSVYVRVKEKACNEVGVNFELVRMPGNASEAKVISKIKELNNDKGVTGILVQLPLPEKMDADKIINTVMPSKDVDGLTAVNMEKLAQGDETLGCCTPKGIMELLEKNSINLKGKNIVLVGYGRLVGKPLGLMLKNRNLRFSVCDDQTKNLWEKTRKADILITATGVPNLITDKHVKEGAVVVDAGTAKLGDKIVGDVDFENVKKKASWITPVPGGVGPMTVAMLIRNVVNAYEK